MTDKSPQIVPLDAQQRDQVRRRTEQCLRRAEDAYARPFACIPVLFDLTGRAAGMYRVDRRGRVIRYNPYLFSKYFAENLLQTVPHEVAHYVVDCLYRDRRQPHGREWRAVIEVLGARPEVRADFNLAGVPVRRETRHPYSCACRRHWLTTRTHNRMGRRWVQVRCRHCLGLLIPEEVSTAEALRSAGF